MFSITRSLNVNDSSFKQAAVWSPWRDVTILITLRHDVTPTDTCIVAPLKEAATNEPRREISNNMICATSKDSDQPAHTRSLIRAFASRLNSLCVLCYWLNIWSFGNSKLKRRLHRLVWIYTCQNTTLLEITRHCFYKSSWYPIGTSVQGSWRL